MKLRVPIPNTSFRLGLLIMILKVFLSVSGIAEVPDSLDTILSIAASGLLAGSILQKAYPVKTLFVFICITLLGMLTSVRTGNMMVFIAIITCLAMCGEDLDKAIAFMFFWESLFLILTILLSAALHLSGNSMLTRVSGVMRYNFGYSHPNIFSCILTNLFAMYLWKHYNSVGVRHALIICLIEFVVYKMTDSRTGLIVTLFLVLFTMLFRNNQKPCRFLKFMAAYAVPVLTVMFYCLCKLFASGNGFALLLDKLISGRIRLGAYSLNRFGVSFLGQNLSMAEVKWDAFWKLNSITFDNIYTYLLVTECIWLVVVMVLFYQTVKKSDIKYCVFILAWALYGISEIHVINPFLFFAVVIVTSLFQRDKREAHTWKRNPGNWSA